MKRINRLIIFILLILTLFSSSIQLEAASKPAKTEITSVKSNDEGKLTVKWKKKNYKGYQVQVATDKNFKNNKKSSTIKGSSKTSTTLSSLKKGKKYYVRVRTYKTSGKQKIYSSWSPSKTVTVHKHSYKGKTTKNASCTTPGKTTYTCKCGKSYTKPLAETAHSLDANNVCQTCNVECIVHKNGDITVTVPKNTNTITVYANVKNAKGKMLIYKLSDQDKQNFSSYDEYIKFHGCATSCLTSVLNAKVPSLAFETTDKIINSVEKKVLGSSAFKKNYSKTIKKQMPITMYGITKVFNEYGIKHKYVYNYSSSTAVTEISNNLKKGNPVLICVRSVPDKKWSGSAHTMLLIGFTNDGKAIICDSAIGTGLVQNNVLNMKK